MNCIFCDIVLDANTKPEHVLLNALGGRKTTSRVICSECNNKFGNSIDKELARQCDFFRNLLQLDSGTGRTPPTLKGVKAGNDIINIQGDGTLSLAIKPFQLHPLPEGRVRVEINVSSMEHLQRIIPDIAAAIKASEAELRNQLATAEIRKIERRPDTIHASLSFGGQDAIRSAAKACLVLWALEVGNKEVRSSIYEEARNFITYGNDHFSTERTNLDSRYLNRHDNIKSEYGPIFNFIYVSSDADGRVIGHFTLYNIIGFQVILAETGGIPNRRIGLVSNPLSPPDWSDKAAAKFEQPFSWLETPEYDETFEIQKRRISEVMKTYFDTYLPRELHRIMDTVFNKYGFKDDDPIPHDKLEEMVPELSSRLVAHLLGLPFEERLPEDQVRSLIQGPPSKTK